MTSENNPIFDALLEEALGRREPPDLSPRILRAWAASKNIAATKPQQSKVNGHAAKLGLPQLIHIGDEQVSLPPAVQADSVLAHNRPPQGLCRRDRFSAAASLAVAASIVGVGLAVGLWSMRSAHVGQPPSQQIAATPPAAPLNTPKLVVKTSPQPTVDDHSAASVPTKKNNRPSLPTSELATNDAPAPMGVESPIATPPVAQPAARARSTDAEIVASINNDLNQLWVSAAVQPTPAASNEQWCQRLFNSLFGRAARPAELKRSLDDIGNGGREAVINRLFAAQRYKQEFAQHWAAAWTTRLLGPRGGSTGSLASRAELEKYLTATLASKKPLNEIVREMLTASGSSLPEGTDYNPAVNFLLERWDANGVQATGRVARTLLGHDLQCAQCHQHPTEAWTQEQFWSLNAFFRQMRVERADGTPRVVNVDFSGQRRTSRDGEVFFETPTGLMKSAFPRFLDGTEIATSGMLSVVDRRHELARLVTQSDDFARTMVNDVWKQLLAYGLEPSGDRDSRGLDASLLGPLAAEFVASGYDLQALVRWIVLSESFSRSSQITDLATKDLPEAGEPALFTRYYEKRQAPGDATRLLLAASRIRTTQQGASARLQARRNWLVQANRSAVGGKKSGKAEKTTEKSENKAASAILAEPGSPAGVNSPVRDRGLIAKLAASSMPFDKKVEHLFMTAIARPPISRETRTAADLLTNSGDDQAGVLEDVWWSLVNSSECVLER